jgi:hypothetical protein
MQRLVRLGPAGQQGQLGRHAMAAVSRWSGRCRHGQHCTASSVHFSVHPIEQAAAPEPAGQHAMKWEVLISMARRALRHPPRPTVPACIGNRYEPYSWPRPCRHAVQCGRLEVSSCARALSVGGACSVHTWCTFCRVMHELEESKDKLHKYCFMDHLRNLVPLQQTRPCNKMIDGPSGWTQRVTARLNTLM